MTELKSSHSYLYCAMTILNADIRTFNQYIESLKLYNSFSSLIMYMYFILINTLETLDKINHTVFTSPFHMCSFCQHFLSSSYWQIRKNQEGKELQVTLSFPLHHFQQKQLANTVKGYHRFLHHWYVLEYIAFFLQCKFWFLV